MNRFIENTKNKPPPMLYIMTKVLLYKKKGNCLSLGSGAGVAEIELLTQGWKVTAVDKLLQSYNTMKELAPKKNIKKLKFIESTFEEMELPRMKYDYIIAINSIPFMNKSNLGNLFKSITNKSNIGCIYTMTFFGKTHTFVTNGSCFGMTVAEVNKLLKKYKIELLYIEQKNINRIDDVLFDVINVIGSKCSN
jgi:cyclopropane fatty-acyl-phospholipid synthase-like methyltransferase